jgi:NAD(P)-dependent dehydrogenase (short-subunit alcohol dehydrogenase family)
MSSRGFAQVKELFGQLDAIVANAGIEQPTTTTIDQLADAEIHQVIDTNLKGALFAAKFDMPVLKKPGGSFIITSSLWGLLGGMGLTAYSATKGGINALMRSLAVEWGPQGVRVNVVSPGAIETPMLLRYTGGADLSSFYKANVPLQRSGHPEEVAAAIVWLSSENSNYVTGQVLSVDGGITSKMSTAPQ